VRAEEGTLIVSPAEKLSATLRAQLAEQKEADPLSREVASPADSVIETYSPIVAGFQHF
jgi:hypothetical protein